MEFKGYNFMTMRQFHTPSVDEMAAMRRMEPAKRAGKMASCLWLMGVQHHGECCDAFELVGLDRQEAGWAATLLTGYWPGWVRPLEGTWEKLVNSSPSENWRDIFHVKDMEDPEEREHWQLVFEFWWQVGMYKSY